MPDEVTQGHQKCHHSIAWVWLPIRLQQQLWLYLTPFLRYNDLLDKNCPIFSPLVFVGTPIRDEAVRVKQRPLAMKN